MAKIPDRIEDIPALREKWRKGEASGDEIRRCRDLMDKQERLRQKAISRSIRRERCACLAIVIAAIIWWLA